MTITIHRGSQEIGGLCIELGNSWGERILLDAGRPLEEHPDGPEFDQNRLGKALSPINEHGTLLGVVYSHGHQDHLGFDCIVPLDIPRWLGQDTLALFRLRHDAGFLQDRNGMVAPNWDVYKTYESEKHFEIGQFRITPWLMDHSAMDAYALEVVSDGQRVIFTGDFRAHGRKANVLDHFMEHVDAEPDVLLSEGTNMPHENASPPETEQAIEERLVQLCNTTLGHVFVQCSAENIDRIVGLYRVCKRTERTLVVDLYTALVLQAITAEHENIPYPGKTSWANLKVWYPQPLTKRLVDKLGEKSTVFHFKHVQLKRKDFAGSGKVVMLVRPTMQKELEKWLPEAGEHAFVFSLWHGYLKDPKTASFAEFMAQKGAALHRIHTSGHADPATIQILVNTLKPRVLIPVHTMSPHTFNFPGIRVEYPQDGTTFYCSTVEQMHNPGLFLGRQFREIASWQLIAALVAQAPDRYRVVEQHPGDGMYDVLALFARDTHVAEAYINRNGSFHNKNFHRLTGLWERLAGDTSLLEVLRLIHEIMNLPCPKTLGTLSNDASDIQIYTTFMASLIGALMWTDSHWEWRMGLCDSSVCSELRTDGFEQFPEASQWLQKEPSDSQLWRWCTGVYDIWFLYQDGIPVAVLHGTGWFQVLGGTMHDLRKACKEDGWNVKLTAQRLFEPIVR